MIRNAVVEDAAREVYHLGELRNALDLWVVAIERTRRVIA